MGLLHASLATGDCAERVVSGYGDDMVDDGKKKKIRAHAAAPPASVASCFACPYHGRRGKKGERGWGGWEGGVGVRAPSRVSLN